MGSSGSVYCDQCTVDTRQCDDSDGCCVVPHCPHSYRQLPVAPGYSDIHRTSNDWQFHIVRCCHLRPNRFQWSTARADSKGCPRAPRWWLKSPCPASSVIIPPRNIFGAEVNYEYTRARDLLSFDSWAECIHTANLCNVVLVFHSEKYRYLLTFSLWMINIFNVNNFFLILHSWPR